VLGGGSGTGGRLGHSPSTATEPKIEERAVTTTVQSVDDLKPLVGQHLGYSDWVEIDQDRVNLFADATGDHQWIHVDPERAKDGPFGGTIAHGYLTLSLVPVLARQVLAVEAVSLAVNYGCNKVRFPSPVPVGSSLRLGAALASVEDVEGGVQVTLDVTLEARDAPKPACVSSVVYRYYR
jgi:acyl dehydratase